MTIAAGQLVPDLSGTTFRGQHIDLEQYRGQKVWVAFHRWASCPLCNLRIKDVIERYDEFEEQGIQLICVFQSPPENIARYVGAQDPPFPIIADPELRLYDVFGVRPNLLGNFYPRVLMTAFRAVMAGLFSVKIDGPISMVPADFLIDPEGLVWKAYYGAAVSDHIPFDDIERFIADPCLDMPNQIT
jgi:peroxiredoxin